MCSVSLSIIDPAVCASIRDTYQKKNYYINENQKDKSWIVGDES